MTALRPLTATPGGQLQAFDVIGRNADVARAWERLAMSSVRLNEPRRLGKTSVLTKMATEQPAGWQCVKLSLQGVNSTTGFATALLAALHSHRTLPSRAAEAARRFLSKGSAKVGYGEVSLELSAAFRDDPMLALQASLREVSNEMLAVSDRLVLACDEVPDMLLAIADQEGNANSANLLAVLRRFRDEDAASQIRWLLTGSIGIHHVLREIGSSEAALNDLDPLTLGPLSVGWATWLTASLLLGEGIDADETTAAEIAHVTNGIPYLEHLIVAYVRDVGGRQLPGTQVEAAFDQAINDLDASQQSTHLLTRLGPYYGADTSSAEWVLDQIALAPARRTDLIERARQNHQAIPGDSRLRDLLDMLRLDHYLDRSASGLYEWRYPALQRIWKVRRA